MASTPQSHIKDPTVQVKASKPSAMDMTKMGNTYTCVRVCVSVRVSWVCGEGGIELFCVTAWLMTKPQKPLYFMFQV